MSLYSITSASLTPDPVPPALYAQLTDDDGNGAADCDVDALISAAEAEFNSHLLGMFSAAASIALARPLVLDVCVYYLHLRRAQNADYQIPEAIASRYNKAIAWADGRGGDLLAAEGSSSTPAKSGTDYTAPASTFEMADLDRL